MHTFKIKLYDFNYYLYYFVFFLHCTMYIIFIIEICGHELRYLNSCLWLVNSFLPTENMAAVLSVCLTFRNIETAQFGI